MQTYQHQANGSRPGYMLRKMQHKLPWLDGNASSRNMPGGFDSDLGAQRLDRSTEWEPRAPPDDSSKPGLQPSISDASQKSTLFSGRTFDIVPQADFPPTKSTMSLVSTSQKDISLLLSQPRTPVYQQKPSQTTHEPADEARQSAEILELAHVASPKSLGRSNSVLSGRGPDIPHRTSSLARTHDARALDADRAKDVEPIADTLAHQVQQSGKTTTAPSMRVPAPPAALSSIREQHADADINTLVPLNLSHGANAHGDCANRVCSVEDAVMSLQCLMQDAVQIAQSAVIDSNDDHVMSVLHEATLALRQAHVVSQDIDARLHDRRSFGSDSHSSSDSSCSTGSLDDTSQSTRTTDATLVSNDLHSPRGLPTDYSRGRPESPAFDLCRPGDYYPESFPFAPVPMPVDDQRYQTRSMPADQAASESSSLRRPYAPSRLYNPPSADSIVIDFAYSKHRTRRSDGTISPASREIQDNCVCEQPTCSLQGEQDHAPRDHDIQGLQGCDSRLNNSPLQPASTESSLLAQPSVEDTSAAQRQPELQSPAQRRLQSSYNRMSNAPRNGQDHVKYETGDVLSEERKAPKKYSSTAERKDSAREHKYRRRGIAREWEADRKRIAAIVACLNTTLIGLVAGIYAGEVPKIQYQLADQHHRIILGNVFLFIALGLSTLFTWPLPLLHGRKPYVLVSLALTLPLQFPQALAVSQMRDPATKYYLGLLLPRAISGLCLGFTNTNCIAQLFDLYGASLQSHRPHQEIVDYDDVRRQGGGMGLWLGVWSFCFVASLAFGFLLGAAVTASLDPAWGFYILIILLAVSLLVNVIAPETRRAPHRRSILHIFDEEQNVRKLVARGEVKLHTSRHGPKHWWEEVWAGLVLMWSMLLQPGFSVLALYVAWIYAMVVLVTLLLGALLSTEYRWRPQYVGLAVFALVIGSLLAVPLSKASLFSRDRKEPPRTDSMTFQPRVSWSSHLVRRCIFTFALPIAALAFTLTSPGPRVSWAAPVIMSALVGFLTTLALAECVGLIMETFDTCDLQPGINSKHRLQSLESTTRKRRTNYSSFPRVAAGVFVAQALGFFLAAAATGVSGHITRALGAQTATAITAGILLFFTILLSIVLWRFRTVQVIPNHALGTKKGSKDWTADDEDKYWKAVIVGNPSGKVRRMNLLESGAWSRWTEIRRLNRLSKHHAE